MIKVILVLVVVQSIFSLWPVLIKMALQTGVSALHIALVRDLVASLLLWIGVWIESGYPGVVTVCKTITSVPTNLLNADWLEKSIFLILGISSSINSIGYVLALRYVSAFNAALLHPTIPVFAAVLGSCFGVEKLTTRKIVGACICIIGSLVVVVSQADMSISLSLFGNILLVLQSFAMACLLVGQKFVLTRHSSLKTTALYYSTGCVLSTPIVVGILLYNNEMRDLTKEAGYVIGFGALFVVAVNHAALTWANKASTPAVPASSMMLQPPFTYILSYLLGGRQQVGWWEVGGGCVIVLGLTFTTVTASQGDGKNDNDNTTYEKGDYMEEEHALLISADVGSESPASRGYSSDSTFQSPGPLTKRNVATPQSSPLLKSSPTSLDSVYSAASSRSSSPSVASDDFPMFPNVQHSNANFIHLGSVLNDASKRQS